MLKGLAIAAAVLVIVGGVFGYFVSRAFGAANTAQSAASGALETARGHSFSIEAQLKATSGAKTFDPNSDASTAQLKQAVDAYSASLQQAQTTLRADVTRLNSADGQLQAAASNPLAIVQRPGLDHSASRVESLVSAFQAADTGLGMEHDLAHALSAMVDVFSDFDTVGQKEQAKDYAGALGVYGTLDPHTQTVITAVQGQDIPGEVATFANAVKTLVNDNKTFLTDLLSISVSVSDTVVAANRVEADVTAIQNVDIGKVDSEEQTILQPYISRYESGARAAGFTLSA